MGSTGPDKTCKLCGEDCAGQPRIKDSRGNYYHRSCHEEAKRSLAAHDALASSKSSVALPGIDSAPESDSRILLGALIDDVEPPPRGPVRHCPECGLPLAPGDLFCSTCSHDLPPLPVAAAPTRVGTDRAGDLWPTAIGILSTTAGLVGAIGFGLVVYGAYRLAPWEASRFISIVMVLSTLFPLLMSLWLAFSGIGVIRHKPTAPSFIARWAVWMIIITVLLAAIFVLVQSGALSDRRAFQDPAVVQVLDDVFPAAIKCSIGMLAWPIFILIWFTLPRIKTQTAEW